MACLGTGLILSMTMPAQAAFFSEAEQFLISSFPQAAAAVPLIFNALRGILLIYLAIALIQVLNAFRQGEEWISLARSPLAVVIVVVMGSVLSTLIIS